MSTEKLIPHHISPQEVTIKLFYATIPGLLRFMAVHYWFVVSDETGIWRLEVWQKTNAGGRSIGHVHCNLKPPRANVGGGPTKLAATWRGTEALRLRQVLMNVAAYPFCHTYRYWPGPNSNTFVAWVLRKAGIQYVLGLRAFGKSYAAT